MKLSRVRGLTLIELLVTVAISAIMVAIAVPAMRSFISGMQLRTAANDLSSALMYARAESIKRGWPVTLCKTATASSATPTCSTAANWQDGWLVFVDRDGNGSITTTDPEEILLRVGTVKGSGHTISGGTNFANYVSYGPSGVSKGSGGLPNGTFTLCLNGSSRSIVVNTTGRTSMSSGSC